MRWIFFLGIVCLTISCGQSGEGNQMSKLVITHEKNLPIFAKGRKGLSAHYSGDVWISILAGNGKHNDYSVENITFGPRARTHWKTHPKGQILLVLEGKGYYKQKGKPVRMIKKGDVIKVPPDVICWLGATPSNQMVCLAITNYRYGINTVWGEPVSDNEYSRLAPR